jgi:hypothetical protein
MFAQSRRKRRAARLVNLLILLTSLALLPIASVRSYTISSWSWQERTVGVRIGESIPEPHWQQEIEKAINDWNAVGGQVRLVKVSEEQQAKIKLTKAPYICSKDIAVACVYEVENVSSSSGYLDHCYIGLNSALPIGTQGESDKSDLYSITLHELGHCLGLDHSTVPSAVMYRTIPDGVRKTITDDDQAGIWARYPLGGTWVSPTNGEQFTTSVHLAAHAHDHPGGYGVNYVNFTAYYNGAWRSVCTIYSPTHDDVYECDWNFSGAPIGNIPISFDVYGNAGSWNHHNAPHGTRTIVYDPSSSGTTPSPVPMPTSIPSSNGIEIVSVSSHTVQSGEQFSPSVTIKVTSGQLDPAQGHHLHATPEDHGNIFGAWPVQPLKRVVSAGQTYTFDVANDSGFRMTAPSTPGTYRSVWQMRVGGNHIGPQAIIQVNVQPTGDGIELCDGENFGGECKFFAVQDPEGKYSDLSSVGFYDLAESVRFVGACAGGNRCHAVLHSEKDFQGDPGHYDNDSSTLGNAQKNHVRSVTVYKHKLNGIELCDGENFGGECKFFGVQDTETRWNDLSSVGFYDRAESVRFRGSCAGGLCHAVLHSEKDGQGDPAHYDYDTPTLGNAQKNHVRSVTLYRHRPPSAPNLESPTDNATFTLGQPVQLNWSTNGEQYQVELTGQQGTQLLGWQTEATKALTSLAGGQYSWRVQAKNRIGEGPWSSYRTFTVQENTPPPPTGSTFEDFQDGPADWNTIGSVANVQEGSNQFRRFTPPSGSSAESARQVTSAALTNYTAISVRINTHGASLLGNDASALYLNQGGWKYVALSNYIQQGLHGWQTVEIPLTDFLGFNKANAFSQLGFRFWVIGASTIDIDEIVFIADTTSEMTEVLPSPWNLQAEQGDAVAEVYRYQEILSGKDTLRITYNLHGMNALPGLNSTVSFSQNNVEKSISLAEYGQNGYEGWQTIDVPLADVGYDPTLPVDQGNFWTHFWYGSPYHVEISGIKAYASGGSSTTTQTFIAVEDAYVEQERPTSILGTEGSVGVDSSPLRDGYLKFDLTSLVGKTVSSAKLRLYIVNASTGTQSLYEASSAWNENTITWNNRPAFPQSSSDFITTVNTNNVANQWLELDITNAIQVGRVYSLGLDTTNDDGIAFNSHNGSSNPSELVITYQ